MLCRKLNVVIVAVIYLKRLEAEDDAGGRLYFFFEECKEKLYTQPIDRGYYFVVFFLSFIVYVYIEH